MADIDVDPTETLESKLLEFAESLSDDELIVFHDLLHLASEGSKDVEGYALRAPRPTQEDPCQGGEVTFPNTFVMLGNLHTKLHIPPRR